MSIKTTTSFTGAAIVTALITGLWVDSKFFGEKEGNPDPMDNFDIDRYGGVWYDILYKNFGDRQACGQYQLRRENRKDFEYLSHW